MRTLSPLRALGLGLALTLALCPRAWGVFYTTQDSANPLEILGHSARATAMGTALVAVEGDESDLLWNPAGLAGIPSVHLSLSHDSWLEDVIQENLLLAIPLSKRDTLALGSTYVNYGKIDGYDSTGLPTASYQPNRISTALGWGGWIFDRFAVGLDARGFLQNIGGSSFSTFFAGAGVLWSPTSSLRVGLSYSDFGIGRSPYSNTGAARVGFSWMGLRSKDASTLLAASMVMPPYGVYRLQLGVEEALGGLLFLRAGYQFDLVDNQIPGLQFFSSGVGFRLGDLDLDYAFLPIGELGASHRVSLGFRFGETPPPTPAPARPAILEGVTGFAPPTLVRPQDQVEKVELQFHLPGQSSTPPPGASKWAGAIQRYEKFLQDHPQSAQGWQILGKLYFESGRAAEGLQCLEESLRLKPDNQALRDWVMKYRANKP